MSYEFESSSRPVVDKIGLLRAFNKHFFDFIDDIITVLPDNDDILVARSSFNTIKHANPSAIVKAWHKFVFLPYSEHLFRGDLAYFLQKDYRTDVETLHNANRVMEVIDTLRAPLQNMGETNQQMSIKYLQNLCKLSDAYTSA